MSNDQKPQPGQIQIGVVGGTQTFMGDQALEISVMPGCIQIKCFAGLPGQPCHWAGVRINSANDDIDRIISMLQAAKSAAQAFTKALAVEGLTSPPGRLQ